MDENDLKDLEKLKENSLNHRLAIVLGHVGRVERQVINLVPRPQVRFRVPVAMSPRVVRVVLREDSATDLALDSPKAG